jgi:FkbM family methyltransferase
MSLISAVRHIVRKPVVNKLIWSPARFIPQNAAIPILRGPLQGKRWIFHSTFTSCWSGFYEYEKQELFRSLVKTGDVVFDVGANVGYYTLLAATLVGPSGTVHSFEPSPRNASILRKHISCNRLVNVEFHEAAVSDKDGEAFFDFGEMPEMGFLSDEGDCRVLTLRLDSIWKRGTGVVPNLLKIDVEGAEMQVLDGAVELISGARPDLLIATHSIELHEAVCDWMADHQYSTQLLEDPYTPGSTKIGLGELLAKPMPSVSAIENVSTTGDGSR